MKLNLIRQGNIANNKLGFIRILFYNVQKFRLKLSRILFLKRYNDIFTKHFCHPNFNFATLRVKGTYWLIFLTAWKNFRHLYPY